MARFTVLTYLPVDGARGPWQLQRVPDGDGAAFQTYGETRRRRPGHLVQHVGQLACVPSIRQLADSKQCPIYYGKCLPMLRIGHRPKAPGTTAKLREFRRIKSRFRRWPQPT